MGLFQKKALMGNKKLLAAEIQLRFLKRLYQLLLNGHPLIDALEIIKWDKELVEPASKIITVLKTGTSFDQALEQARFHDSITSYFYFIQEVGDVREGVEKCIEMYEDRLKYTKKFQQVARYPLILLFIFGLLLYFIKSTVLPSFSDLFQSNAEVSSTIKFSIELIDYLMLTMIIISSCSIILYIVWKFNKHRYNIAQQINLYKKIPILRRYLMLQTSFQFATHLSSLLKTGRSLRDILDNMSGQTKLPIIAHYASLLTEGLSRGLSVAALLPDLYFLEKQFIIIFQKNMDRIALEKDLTMYAEVLTEELQRKIMKALTLIQPIFFILLAIFVVFIYLTLMLPMYQLIQNL